MPQVFRVIMFCFNDLHTFIAIRIIIPTRKRPNCYLAPGNKFRFLMIRKHIIALLLLMVYGVEDIYVASTNSVLYYLLFARKARIFACLKLKRNILLIILNKMTKAYLLVLCR